MPTTVTITQFSGGITEVPPSTAIVATSNYLWELMGRFGVQALSYIGMSGGSVAPPAPPATLNPYQFVVSSSSLIPTGSNSATLTSFIGNNVMFIRNNLTQSNVENGGTWFTWNKTTGQFVCIGDASEGELFQIYPI